MRRSRRGLGAGIVQDGGHFSRLGVIFPEEKITASGLGPLARVDWSPSAYFFSYSYHRLEQRQAGKGREEGILGGSPRTPSSMVRASILGLETLRRHPGITVALPAAIGEKPFQWDFLHKTAAVAPLVTLSFPTTFEHGGG